MVPKRSKPLANRPSRRYQRFMLGPARREQETEERREGSIRVGAVLRSARRAHSMTVREVAEQLRLSAHYLCMLEAGDYSAIADELYLQPFARQYAQLLGLDAGLISSQFVAGIEVGVKFDHQPQISQEVPARQRWWPTTVAVLFFVTLAVYLVARSVGP